MSVQAVMLGEYGAAGGGGVTGLLASWTGKLWGAYALQQLLSTATKAIRVRRDSDNTEQDIGFSGTALDTTSLATFVSTNSGFITKWYDQSGGGNDLVQATTTKQPLIVDVGTYVGEIAFDGLTHVLTTSNSSGTPSAITVLLAGRDRVQGAATADLIKGPSTLAVVDLRVTSAANYSVDLQNEATAGGLNQFTGNLWSRDNVTYAAKFDRSQVTLALQLKDFVAGVLQTSSATSGSTAAGNYTSGTWSLGSDGTNPARVSAKTFLLYEAAISDANIATIGALVTPAPASVPLDSFTSSLWGAYALKKLLTSYAGSCIQVRRSSDNTTQDIGFSGGLLDIASMLTFVGAGNGFISKWYDQSGSTHDFLQATTGNQPQIVASGVVNRAIVFDDSNDLLTTSASSGTPSAFTLFLRGWIRNMTDAICLEHSANYNSNQACVVEPGASANRIGFGIHGSAGYARSDCDINMQGQVMAFRADRSQASAALMSNIFSGGHKLTITNNGSSGTLPSGNFAANAWNLGARNGGTAPCALDCDTCLIYESAVSDASIERISRGLG